MAIVTLEPDETFGPIADRSTQGSFVFGTVDGHERVSVTSGTIVFDASFNAGGDVIELAGVRSGWTAQRSGSSVVLEATGTRVVVPISTATTTLAFADGEAALRFDDATGRLFIGGQAIATSVTPLMPTNDPVVPIVLLAGQSNADLPGVDAGVFAALSRSGDGFVVVKVAEGGVSLLPSAQRDWSPASGELFTDLVTRARTAVAEVTARGYRTSLDLLWVQGEADVAVAPDTYRAALAGFVDALRRELGDALEVTIALLPFAGNVRTGQLAYAAADPRVATIETLGAGTIDGIHYDQQTAEAIGERFVDLRGLTAAPAALNTIGIGPVGTLRDDADGITFVIHPYGAGRFEGDDRPDTVTGGAGSDWIETGGGSDMVNGGGGADRIDTGEGGDTIDAGYGDDHVSAGDGGDYVLGRFGDDRIDGGDGDDTVIGGWGDDRLFGGAGDDVLAGEQGRDTLTGGAGADRFAFFAATDTNAAYGIDIITDFDAGAGDRIDLSAIDADIAAAGDQAFAFVGTAAFSGRAGELRAAVDAGMLRIEGDIDGDRVADLVVLLADRAALDPAGLIL